MAAFGASLVVHARWFPLLSKNNDEAVYLFQAELFRQGRATLSAAAMGHSFRPWMSGPIGDRLIMVFPPGWPAVLAVGTALFRSAAIVAALSAAAVAIAAHAFGLEVTRRKRVALITAGFVSFSPFLVVLGATALSYPFALALDLVAATFALRAVRQGRPRLLLVTGLTVGLLFTARPVDAGLVTITFGGWLLWSWRRRVAWPRIGTGAMFAAVGALPFIAATLVYNARVTGDALRFPLDANGGNNQFGFGLRQLSIDAPLINATPSLMWEVTVRNLRAMPLWWVGGVASLPLAIAGIAILWRKRRDLASVFAITTIAWPLAHFFYCGTIFVAFGRRDFGPFYYLPVIIPVALCSALAFDRLLTWRRPAAIVAGVALAGVTIAWGYGPPLRRAAASTAIARREVALVDRAALPALVVLPASADGPWIMHVRGYFRNHPDLNGPVLYSADDGAADVTLFDRFPRRAIYNLYGEAPPGQVPHAPQPHLARLRRTRSEALTVHVRFINGQGDATVVAYLATPNGIDRCVLDESSVANRTYDVTWNVSPNHVVGPAPCIRQDHFGLLDTLSGGLLVGFSSGSSSDFFGVNRYESLYPIRLRPGAIDILTPGVQRRTLAGDFGRRLGVYNARSGPALHIEIDPVGPMRP